METISKSGTTPTKVGRIRQATDALIRVAYAPPVAQRSSGRAEGYSLPVLFDLAVASFTLVAFAGYMLAK